MKETVANTEMRKEKSVIKNEEEEVELVILAEKLMEFADETVIVATMLKVKK